MKELSRQNVAKTWSRLCLGLIRCLRSIRVIALMLMVFSKMNKVTLGHASSSKAFYGGKITC